MDRKIDQNDPATMRIVTELTDRLLDLVYSAGEMTTSDLQSAASAIAVNALQTELPIKQLTQIEAPTSETLRSLHSVSAQDAIGRLHTALTLVRHRIALPCSTCWEEAEETIREMLKIEEGT